MACDRRRAHVSPKSDLSLISNLVAQWNRLGNVNTNCVGLAPEDAEEVSLGCSLGTISPPRLVLDTFLVTVTKYLTKERSILAYGLRIQGVWQESIVVAVSGCGLRSSHLNG